MAATFQVIALSSLDPVGADTGNEPQLLYPDAYQAAQELKAEGKAFRVFANGDCTDEQRRSFIELGALFDR